MPIVPEHPKVGNLTRTANRHRQRNRPPHPNDIDFELDLESIPENGDFCLADITVGDGEDERRHLMFGTQEQLTLLRQAKRWYMDGTFKVKKTNSYKLIKFCCFMSWENLIAKLLNLCSTLYQRSM